MLPLAKRAGIRRRQIDRRDVGIGEPGLLQRLHHDVVGAGTLGEADALALQVGDQRIGESFGTRMPWPLVMGWPAA